jgi:hypothetical protein
MEILIASRKNIVLDKWRNCAQIQWLIISSLTFSFFRVCNC